MDFKQLKKLQYQMEKQSNKTKEQEELLEELNQIFKGKPHYFSLAMASDVCNVCGSKL